MRGKLLKFRYAGSHPLMGQTSPYLPYRRVLLPGSRIRELSTLKPWIAMGDIAQCWAWIVAALSLVALHPAWWTVMIAIPVIGNRYYGLFIIGHDGMHRRLLPNIREIDFWTDLLILAPIGAITRINNRNHLAHHRHLATSQDPDRHKHACFNKNSHPESGGLSFGVHQRLEFSQGGFFYGGDGQTIHPTGQILSDDYTFRDFALLLGWFAVLAGGLTWFIGWWAYPVLWLLPVYAFMFLGDNFRSCLCRALASRRRSSGRPAPADYLFQ